MTWKTIGFENLKSFFEKMANADLFNHAYLFSGPAMIGKKTFALEIVSRSFMNQNLTGHNPDLIYLDPADSENEQSIGITEIRKVKSFLSLSPLVGKYKFVIINDAHLMTEEAQNALLKILEEPSQSSVLILVTSNSNLLLPTVISRCQEIKFSSHSKLVVADVINVSKLDTNHQKLIVELSSGRIGLAMNILAENSFEEVKKAIENLAYLARSDIEEKFAFAQKMSDDKNRSSFKKQVLYWMLYARTRLNEPKASKILKGLLILNQTINQSQYNFRLALENFLINI